VAFTVDYAKATHTGKELGQHTFAYHRSQREVKVDAPGVGKLIKFIQRRQKSDVNKYGSISRLIPRWWLIAFDIPRETGATVHLHYQFPKVPFFSLIKPWFNEDGHVLHSQLGSALSLGPSPLSAWCRLFVKRHQAWRRKVEHKRGNKCYHKKRDCIMTRERMRPLSYHFAKFVQSKEWIWNVGQVQSAVIRKARGREDDPTIKHDYKDPF